MADEHSEDSGIKVVKLKGDEKEEEEETLNEHNPTKHFIDFVSLNFLSEEDERYLRKFFAKHPDAYFVDEAFSFKTQGFAYGRFADLLRFLYEPAMLKLLGSKRSELSAHLHDLRHFSFKDKWLDTVERLLFPCILSPFDISHRSLRKFLDSEARLREDIEILSSKVDSLSYRKELLEIELAKVREKKHAVLKSIYDLRVFLTF